MNGDGKITLEMAKTMLRYDLDLHDEDFLIQNYIDEVPKYIYDSTGLTPAEQESEPLCQILTRCLLIKWHERDWSFDQSINTMLATLKFKVTEKRAKEKLEATE